MNDLPQESPADYKQREAYIAWIKGRFYVDLRDYDLALKHLEHSLALREEYGTTQDIIITLGGMSRIFIFFKVDYERAIELLERGRLLSEEIGDKWCLAQYFYFMGIIHKVKGELERSISIFNQGLTIFNDLNNKLMVATVLSNIGEVYQQRGDLERALECLEQALALRYESGNSRDITTTFDFLIQILIDKGELEQAQQYLHRYEQLKNQLKDKEIDTVYLLNKALILKMSSRIRKRAEAEVILTQILEDEESDFELILTALTNLCELLLTELRITNDLDVLEEINPLIARLLDNAEKTGSYSILCETYLLQAKLSLLTFNIKKAKRFLTQAQQIAEKYGLNQLAIKISNEHDELLNQLSIWENLKQSNTSLADRIKFTRLGEQMENMVRKHVTKAPVLETEQPVLLTIISKKGSMIFSNPFTADMTFDVNRIGDFLSSFNTFSDQIFSESLDRVKFLDFTLILKEINSFIICYMFKGQSYSAQQKLLHFSNALTNQGNTIKILNSSAQSGSPLSIKEIPLIEELISESFLSDPQKFQVPFKAYEGEKPYLFVSYAHVDKLHVYPIIDYLNKAGINIWYDEGIPISENWRKTIVENIEKCKTFLVFITPHILDSDYVQKEINFALKKHKAFFAVYIKETKLPSELEFEISSIQHINKYLMPESKFYDKLKTELSSLLTSKIV